MSGRVYETIFELGGRLNSTFRRMFQRADQDTNGLDESLRNLQDGAKKTDGVFGKLGKAVGNFGGILGKVAQYTGAYAIVTGVADAMGNLAASIFDNEDAFNQLQASTGASIADMKELKSVASNIYAANLGDDFNDVTLALASAKQVTQQTGKALEETTKNAIMYRDVFGEDISESIKAADTMMKNFGISADQAYNLMAQGAQKGLNKSGELLDSANEYAPHFNSLGFSADQMFDTFSAGLESGAFNLDKVGDAVKEFNIRSKDMSNTSIEAYQALGLNAEQMSQTFANGGPAAQKAFKDIVASISSIEDPVRKNAIGVGLFGTQFEDVEKDVIAAMGTARSQFDMTADTMQEINAVKYDSVSKAFRGIGRQLYVDFIMPINGWLLPHLNNLAKWFKTTIPVIKGFFGQVGKVIGTAFGPIKDVFKSLFSDAISEDNFGGVFNSLLAIKDDLLGVWDTVAPHFKSIVGSIGKIFKELSPTVLKVASTFYKAGLKIYQAFVPAIAYINGKLYPIFSKVFGFLANDVAPAVTQAFNSMLPSFLMIAGKIGQTVSAIFNSVKPFIDGLVAIFEWAFPYIKVAVMDSIRIISGVFNGLMTTLGGVLDFITGVFSGNWSTAWQGIKDIFGGIFSGLGAMFKAPINAVIGLINQAISSINSISVDIPDWVPDWAGGGKSLGFSMREIPMLATGGITTGPTLAMIGEGREDEAILPLSKLESMLNGPSYNTSSNSNSNMEIVYAPKFYISGTATQHDADRVAKANADSFDKQVKQWKKQRQRVVLA